MGRPRKSDEDKAKAPSKVEFTPGAKLDSALRRYVKDRGGTIAGAVNDLLCEIFGVGSDLRKVHLSPIHRPETQPGADEEPEAQEQPTLKHKRAK